VDVLELRAKWEGAGRELVTTAASPLTIASRSAAVRSPARARALAHATLPATSCGQSRRSKAREPVKRSAAGSAP
jgi:hypothetical protein